MQVCIPTTSGTGAEVTPFAVITDDTDPTHIRKYPIADYALTPEMAIIDPQLSSILVTPLQGVSATPRAKHTSQKSRRTILSLKNVGRQ